MKDKFHNYGSSEEQIDKSTLEREEVKTSKNNDSFDNYPAVTHPLFLRPLNIIIHLGTNHSAMHAMCGTYLKS